MSSTNYRITCINTTKNGYHFGVYQTFPYSPGLQSVAWKVRGVPPQGEVPSTADIDWSLTYGLAITDFDPDGQKYTGRQIVAANLGKAYQVTTTDGDIPTIDPAPTGNATSGNIQFTNNTNRALHLGFTIDLSIAAAQYVGGGEVITFNVHPTYYVACYRSIQPGQLVDSGIALAPVTLEYKNGYTRCDVSASVVSERLALKNPVYTS